MSITDISYQDQAIDCFQQALVSGRLSHAYILTGPSGVGKFSTAKQLAKILLCDKPVKINHGTDSCGKCQSCTLVRAGNHPDLHLVYKELIATISGKELHKATELGIDVIRQEVIEKIGKKAFVGKNKIFIISEAHLMSRAAQNALLKTLEEPPQNTYLFLICDHLGALLSTIRSRAQTLVFKILPDSFIYDRLIQAGANEKQGQYLTKFAAGRLAAALELFRLGVYDLKEKIGKDLAVIDPVFADDFASWILEESKTLAQKMIDDKDEELTEAEVSESEMNRKALKLILSLIGNFCSDSLRYSLGFEEKTLTSSDQIKTVKALAEKNTIEQLRKKIMDLQEAEKLIDANVNVTLVVTNVVNALA